MQILRIFIAFGILALAQNAQAQIKFFKIYSNMGYDFGEGVTQLSDSSYLVTGGSSSFGYGPSQAFILKVDSMGNHQWAKSHGGTESDWGRRIFAVEDDGIYVAGHTNSYGNGSFDFYFLKTDMDGNMLFEKTYGGTKFEKLHGAVMMPDTTFILVGETLSNETEVEDAYMVRLKANGDTIWTKKWGFSGKDIARNINIINDTSVVVVGDYYDEDSLMQKAFVMRVNIDGTIEWTQTSGGQGVFSLNDIVMYSGRTRAVGYNKVIVNGTEKSYLYRLILEEGNGDVVFELIDQNVAYSRLDYITNYGSAGNFYVAEQALLTNTPVYDIGEDCLIQRYSYFLYWDNSMLNTSYIGQDQANQMIPTSDGGAMVVGYNSHYGAGTNNVMLIKIGPNDNYPASYTPPVESTLVYTEELSADFKLSVYPNPVENILHITSEVNGNKSLAVMDAFGKVLSETDFDLASEIDFKTYESGVYLVKIAVDGKVRTVKVVKR